MRNAESVAILSESPEAIAEICEAAGYELWSEDSSDPPDIIILEKPSNPNFIRLLRYFTDIPIIVLGASDDELAQVRALDAGADIYLDWPDSGEQELIARVKSLLRRYFCR